MQQEVMAARAQYAETSDQANAIGQDRGVAPSSQQCRSNGRAEQNGHARQCDPNLHTPPFFAVGPVAFAYATANELFHAHYRAPLLAAREGGRGALLRQDRRLLEANAAAATIAFGVVTE
jgi:hypothetical protein